MHLCIMCCKASGLTIFLHFPSFGHTFLPSLPPCIPVFIYEGVFYMRSSFILEMNRDDYNKQATICNFVQCTNIYQQMEET